MSKLSFVFALFVAAGCASKPDVMNVDFTRNNGAYLVVYTTNLELRRAMEDQLVGDLAARDILTHPSHQDLPNIETLTRDQLLHEASAKHTIGVLVINQVASDGNGVIDNPLRISPDHPDLKTFFEYSKSIETNYDPNQVVFAEANVFLIDGDKTRLTWSGTSWSFKADGAGTAMRGISETIANELKNMRDEFRRR